MRISDIILNEWNNQDYEELVGEYFDEGSRRDVHAHARDSSLVVKVQKDLSNEQNLREWNYWNKLKGTALEKWFVPCVSMSDDSKYLIQKRAQPLGDRRTAMPAVLLYFDAYNYGDPQTNLGILDGNVVSIDYGLSFIPIDMVLDNMEHMQRMLQYSEFCEVGDGIYFDDEFPHGYYSEDNLEWISGLIEKAAG